LVPALQALYSNLDCNIGHYRRYDKAMVRRLIVGLGVRVEKLQYNNLLGVLASKTRASSSRRRRRRGRV
jgi:hypothetical protein